MLRSKMPFCGTKYTLSREELRVGRTSSKASRVGSEGRTRIMRGTLLRILRRRSSLEGRTIRVCVLCEDDALSAVSLQDHRRKGHHLRITRKLLWCVPPVKNAGARSATKSRA